MSNRALPVPLVGSRLGDTRHVCAFFDSDDDAYRVLLPFMKDGFDAGDRAIHVVDPAQRDDHLRRLTGSGIDTAAAEARGQLELRANGETYLRDGRFDLARMLEMFERFAGGDPGRGFPRSRIVCHMDWAAEGRVVVDDVIEFEARVNEVWRRHDDTVVCAYRRGQLSGGDAIDILRTHPMVIVGSVLQRNPFFVPPEEFVQELRERRARRTV